MGLRLMGDLGVLWAGPDVSFLRGGEQRGGEGEALTCSAFQGIQYQLWWEVQVRSPCRFLGPHSFQLKPLCLHYP